MVAGLKLDRPTGQAGPSRTRRACSSPPAKSPRRHDIAPRLLGAIRNRTPTIPRRPDAGGTMKDQFSPEQRRDLLGRGFSRRDFGRLAAFLTAGAALPFYNEAALAQGLSAGPRISPDTVKINANENPMGPCPEAIEAIHKVVAQGGRY